jgi:integrase
VRKYHVDNDLENATSNSRVSELRAFTRWATKEKYLSHNPLAEVGKLPVPEPKDKLIREQDFDRLLEVCPQYLKEIIWVDWQTGMRLANVVKLRYDQIDFEAGGILYAGDEMKKGKAVFIDLEPELVEWFKRRRAAHPNDIHVWPSPYWSRKSSEDRPRTSAGVGEHFTKYARDLGIDGTFHSIRHTFATRWVKSGVSLFMVGKFLSHKNLQSTQRYAHVADLESQKEAKKRVVQMKGPKLPGKLKVVG